MIYHSISLREGKRVLVLTTEAQVAHGQAILTKQQVQEILSAAAHQIWTNPDILEERPQVVLPKPGGGFTLEANPRTTPLCNESWLALQSGFPRARDALGALCVEAGDV